MVETLRHKKTGGLYEVLFRGAVVHSDAPLADDYPVTVCRRAPDGQIVARFGATPRGSFDVLHHSRLQTGVVIHDGAEVVIYRALNGGPVWVRPTSEIDDGRFEPAPDSATPSGDGGERSTSGEIEGLVGIINEYAEAIRMHERNRLRTSVEGVEAAAWWEGRWKQSAHAIKDILSRITSPSSSGRDPSGPGSRASESWMPQAKDVLEAMQDGGHWRSCSGCHETCEGHETGDYPYSPVYQCYVGSGCHECGGIGVIWEPPLDEVALLRSAQSASRPASVPQDLATLSDAACPGEWCGHLLMEMTEADSDFCDALVNAYRAGSLVSRPTPPDLIQVAREAVAQVTEEVEGAPDGFCARMAAECRAGAVDDSLPVRAALRALQTPHQGLEDGRRPDGHGLSTAIPDGWVLVPREPTPEMLDAAVKGSAADVSYADVEELWPAMLSAAPTPDPTTGGEAPGRDDGWRPIETAPKTDGDIFVSVSRIDDRGEIYRFVTVSSYEDQPYRRGFRHRNGAWGATHWQPVPVPVVVDLDRETGRPLSSAPRPSQEEQI